MKTPPNKSARKAPVRRVFGRLRNVEANGSLYTFELVKDKYDLKAGTVSRPGGVLVRERCCREAAVVGFEALASGGGRQVEVGGHKFNLVFKEDGLYVRERGHKKWKIVSYAELTNAARDQMLLFPESVS